MGESAGRSSSRLLVVDDDMAFRKLLITCLEAEGFQVDGAADLAGMKEALEGRAYQAVVLDFRLGDENGLNGIPIVLRHSPHCDVIMLTGHATIELAVDAMRLGVANFLTKEAGPRKIASDLRRRFLSGGVQGRTVRPPENYGLIGEHPTIHQVIADIDHIKDVDSTVLVYGASGTGKELVACALHRASRRASSRFEAVNCGAIPENLLESELFGHRKGAFTDAKADRKGLFELCSGGTLLLDEIGEMPLNLQVKLLRVLQERRVTPIGAGKSIPIDTRVVAATNRDLEVEVAEGRFREDLFFRLSVLRIDLPLLRERVSDVPLLVGYFLGSLNERFGKSIPFPSHDLIARLKSYDWPGNVRELYNALERGVVLSKDGHLHREDIFRNSARAKASVETLEPTTLAGDLSVPLNKAKRSFEKAYLERLIQVSKGNISEAARISGLYRANIYRLMDRYQIDPHSVR